MSIYRFNPEDLFYNRVKTFPKKDFLIYDAKVYIDREKNSAVKNHSTSVNEKNVPQGFVSLYELNVASNINNGGASASPPAGTSIYPFVTKQGARIAFKTISTSVFDSTSQFAYGDVIKSHYPLSASIVRTRFAASSDGGVTSVTEENGSYTKTTGGKARILALKNTFNKYVTKSIHHAFNASSIDSHLNNKISWDKSNQEMSLIEIPSIFYGSSIKKGSVSLKFYITGTLAAELQDTKKNGELIQVTGTLGAATNQGKVAGIVLYNEGFIALTGSWDLNPDFTDKYVGNDYSNPKWYNFGAGANDGIAAAAITGSAFGVHFEGINYIPTITMFAHAKMGELNNSTNPTFIAKEQETSRAPSTGSFFYRENEELKIKSLEHSRYADSGSFDKQTYISKIGIYDEDRNLIAIAKLASPVRKTEARDLTFKLKMDF
jgi:hypothetical protein